MKKFRVVLKLLLCRYIPLIEFCHKCGIRQPIVWWCKDDSVWTKITGWKNEEAPVNNGVLCPTCFDKLARQHGISLRWVAEKE